MSASVALHTPWLQVNADAVKPTPWRNGGGRTRELLARPDATQWQLRVSLADIDRDGPFSAYPGVRRWIGVVQGAGMRLRFGSRSKRLTPLTDALAFDGASAPECSLLDGPTRDLNLMLRTGSGVLSRVDPAAAFDAPCIERGVFTLTAGVLRTEVHGALTLPAHTLAWHLGPGRCRFEPHAPGPSGWWLGWSPESAT
jgi:uncharacterized protein